MWKKPKVYNMKEAEDRISELRNRIDTCEELINSMIYVSPNKSRQILDLSDHRTQRFKWVEELAELQQAICRDDDIANIVEEIADVYVCLKQMLICYPIEKYEVEGVASWKQDRAIEKLMQDKQGGRDE